MKPTTRLAKPTEVSFEFDLLDLHSLKPQRYPYLLESAISGTRQGRYDILFGFPEANLTLDAGFELKGRYDANNPGFLSNLDAWWLDQKQPDAEPGGLPFQGGWFLLLGYELAVEIEPKLSLSTDPRQPVAVATRIPVAVIRDRLQRTAWIVAENGYQKLVGEVQRDIATAAVQHAESRYPLFGPLNEEPAEDFLAAVEAAKSYIKAGDIFQANLSRQWSGLLAEHTKPGDLYRRLRHTNPAPFAGLAVFDDFSVVSSSPERLVRVCGRQVETRPIAGTRPRDLSGHSDAPLRNELLSHPKERAEHIMLIDLERNDLGRICQPGSVQVDEFMVVESYSHVHHIVSNVTGQLLDTATPGSVIRAIFPGGTITGCPKVRCMEIIHELEDRARGAYTGAMGYLNHDGSVDLNILIRTMTTMKQELTIATGSGIVAESDPVQELEETRAKAKGLLLALTDDQNAKAP